MRSSIWRLAVGGVLDDGALVVQHRRGDVPALVLLADEAVAGVDAAVVVVDDVLHPAGEVAELLVTDSRCVGGDDEEADALVLGGVGVGAGEEEAVVGEVEVPAPDLLADDDEVVAVAAGLGAQAGEVGAGIGFGEPLVESDVGARYGAEEALLLLLRTVHPDGRAEEADALVAGAEPVVGALLGEDELAGDWGVLPAVLLRPGHGEPLPLGHLLAHRADVLVHRVALVVAAVPVRGQLLLVEVADFLAEGLVLGGEGEVHEGSRRPVGAAARPRLLDRPWCWRRCLRGVPS